MGHEHFKEDVQQYLEQLDVQINGPDPWDIQVHDPRFYKRVLAEGSLGLGESYMDKWWDAEKLDELFFRICRADNDKKYEASWRAYWHWLRAYFSNLQSKKRSDIVAKAHYDLGNDLFKCMLDKGMNYSCAYWKNAANLDEAQEAKIKRACDHLGIQKGMKVLDIGCGWGNFIRYAAEKYQAQVTGITVSEEQLHYAKESCRGLSVEVLLMDYRDVKGKFDRIVSIGQFEHVGYKNYRDYFHIAHQNLTDEGLFLLRSIGNNKSERHGEPWIEKYIFPNGMLPSIKQIGEAIENLFVMEYWNNFGSDYDKTLLAWHHNFVTRWDELRKNYDERFYRMWTYYLLSCAGAFRARALQLWEIMLSKKGLPGGSLINT